MTTEGKRVAVIAGAGPAGLTAAYELLRRSEITPLVFESDGQVGGISKTIEYRGNRMDLGGHRFFSKSDWVMRWWQEILPVEAGAQEAPIELAYQGQSREFAPDVSSGQADGGMLIRQRLSRIFYRRRFFDYPLKLNANTLQKMGLLETIRVGASYARSRLFRSAEPRSLAEFLIDRFGERLYRTFFKSYTEKVWGVPCEEISAEWGAQRIKGLSISKALLHAISRKNRGGGLAGQRTETSLIECFLYPRLGPGQMWSEVARRVMARGGEVHLRHRVIDLELSQNRVIAAIVRNEVDGQTQRIACDHFMSSMPVSELCRMLKPEAETLQVAENLPYRDFMTVGLLVERMIALDERAAPNGMPPDNWIYVQEPDVRLGRLQVFNNWSPYLVADSRKVWLGLEYFCAEGDELWRQSDENFQDFAARELEQIGLIRRADVVDAHVVRVPKAYPAYFGRYRDFDRVRAFLDRIPNLYPVGRNGMHRYNNQDHSMLAADRAVTAILEGERGKEAIWAINAEDDYHEERA